MSIKEKIKSNKNILLGILGLAVILVLILTVGSKNGDEAEVLNENEEMAEEERELTALSPAEPVVSGDYEYAFSGVEWIFDTEDEQVVGTGNTYLKMMFADFTRNGNAITFGRPYKLGFHPGTCQSVDFLDTTEISGIPVAYARCSDGATTREFVALQDMENVIIQMKEISLDDAEWQEWYKVNVTEIVR
jgi:hypothetical protein